MSETISSPNIIFTRTIRSTLEDVLNKAVLLAVVLCLALIGANAQTQNTNAPDPMYAAIRSGDTAAVGRLLQGGADVNIKDRRGGATPLMNAAAVGSVETMQLLLDKGADVNARSAAGATALM